MAELRYEELAPDDAERNYATALLLVLHAGCDPEDALEFAAKALAANRERVVANFAKANTRSSRADAYALVERELREIGELDVQMRQRVHVYLPWHERHSAADTLLEAVDLFIEVNHG